MPPLGRSQSNRPRKPFDLAEHNHGEQVDSVRSKIASLMDGVTERRASAQEPPHTASTHSAEHAAPADSSESANVPLPSSQSTGQSIGQSTNAQTDDSQPDHVHATDRVRLDGGQGQPIESGAHPNGIHDSNFYPTRQQSNVPQQQSTQQRSMPVTTQDETAHWPRRSSQPTSPTAESDTRYGYDRNGWEHTSPAAPDQAQVPASSSSSPQSRPTANQWAQGEEQPYQNSSGAENADARWDETRFQNDTFGTRRNYAVADDESDGRDITPAAQESDDENPVSAATAAGAINIKGRSGGILIEVGNGEWPDLLAALTERLAGAANFFRNGTAAIDLAAHVLNEQALNKLRQLLHEHALELVLIRTSAPDTFQVALDMGFSAHLETPEGETTATAQPARSNLPQEHHFVYSGHLRAGQILQRNEHILIIGDVNPGATVISNGDILVWGHLRGVAHAGAGGDSTAVVCALDLTPVQIRIGDLIAIAPEPEQPKRTWRRKPAPVKQPEIAYTAGDRINVEPWDATKFGGIAAFRR